MEERRKTPRMKEENEVTITVISEENNLSKEKIRDILIDNYTKDISTSGVGLQTHIILPVDTLIELEFTSKSVRQQISALGKVKWVKVIIEDESYEAGVEFIDTPGQAIQKLEDYISWKLKSNKSEFIKKEISPIASGNINTIETKESLPNRIKQWIKIAIILLGTISLIAVLLKIFGSIPEFDSALVPDIIIGIVYILYVIAIFMVVYGFYQLIKFALTLNKEGFMWWGILWGGVFLIVFALSIMVIIKFYLAFIYPQTNEKVTKKFDSLTTKSATLPAPPIAAPVLKATPVPVPASVPTPKATQKIKVIGNSDSKRYHLPGMKYYNAVKASHRVEFDSEADAIKAGYNKAPQ
jgi:hypothetical protein